LVATGHIRREESVVAVLTGHVLKDPDYVSQYHRGTLPLSSATHGADATQPAPGAYRNPPRQVAATKSAILECLHRKN
jgi:threonine synthase